MFLRLVNWFVFFCETRSFSNCVEACLTTWALVYWLLEALARSTPAGEAKTTCGGARGLVLRDSTDEWGVVGGVGRENALDDARRDVE